MQALLCMLAILGQAPEKPEVVPVQPQLVQPAPPPWRPVYVPPPPVQQPPPKTGTSPANFAWMVCLLPAIIIAIRIQKQRREEEENKTPYTEEDLMNEWEFKILRDPLSRFGGEAFRARILQEEAAAGWQLVETFDAGRMRLKRRDKPAGVAGGIDPYRLALRTPPAFVLWIVFGALCVIGAGVMLLLGIVFGLIGGNQPGTVPFLLLGGVLAAGIFVVCILQSRRVARQ